MLFFRGVKVFEIRRGEQIQCPTALVGDKIAIAKQSFEGIFFTGFFIFRRQSIEGDDGAPLVDIMVEKGFFFPAECDRIIHIEIEKQKAAAVGILQPMTHRVGETGGGKDLFNGKAIMPCGIDSKSVTVDFQTIGVFFRQICDRRSREAFESVDKGDTGRLVMFPGSKTGDQSQEDNRRKEELNQPFDKHETSQSKWCCVYYNTIQHRGRHTGSGIGYSWMQIFPLSAQRKVKRKTTRITSVAAARATYEL